MFLGLLILIFDWLLLMLHPPDPPLREAEDSREVTVAGRLSDKQIKTNSIVLTLSKAREYLKSEGKSTEQKSNKQLGTILVYLKNDSLGNEGEDTLPKIGEALLIRGKLSLFEEATNPGQFDFRRYYEIRGISCRLVNSEILSVSGSVDTLLEGLHGLRRSMVAVYERQLSVEDAGILKAMILGDRTTLSYEIKGLYQRAGIAHALSISGLHVSILGYGLYKLLQKAGLHRILSGVMCTLLLILYALMVGSSLSTVRAVVMFSTCMLSEAVGRSYDIISALFLSGLMILFTSPMYLYDTGFLLSFGAVAGIALVKPWLDSFILFPARLGGASPPKLKRPIGRFFDKRKLLSGITAGISITLFTLPITLYSYFQFSVYSTLINLVLIPFMGLLVVSALFLALFGLILPVLALPFVIICRITLFLYKEGCYICENLPFAVYVSGRPAVWKIVVYYSILLIVVIISGILLRRRRKLEPGLKEVGLIGKTCSFTVNTACIAVLFLLMARQSPSGLRMVIMDIGQGDSIFFESGGGTTYLMDCGSSSEKEISKYRVIPCLKSLGVSKIDFAIMSHSDMDHISGFMEMLEMEETERLPIGCFILPELGNPGTQYLEFKEKIESAGIPVRFICSGSTLGDGDLSIVCLHPAEGFISEDANECSTVLKIRYGEMSSLLTGDVEGSGEEALIKNLLNQGEITVLKVAHHGSRFSTPVEFLQKVKPRYAVISCGRNNSYGHPHRELIERLESVGSKILITRDSGAVTFTCDGRKLTEECFLEK